MSLRMAIVGTGAMAEYHYKKFASLQGVAIPVCADRKPERSKAFAERYGIPRRYDRIFDLLAAECAAGRKAVGQGELRTASATGDSFGQGRPGTGTGVDAGSGIGAGHPDGAGNSRDSANLIDAVSCAVVDSQHPRIACACLSAGLPLFCEKPMARTLAEARRMADAVPGGPESAFPVVVNFSKRNAPALHALAAYTRALPPGSIRLIKASYRQGWVYRGDWGDWRESSTRRWRLSSLDSSAGILGDLGTHLFDAVLAISGQRLLEPELLDAMDFRSAWESGLAGKILPGDEDDPLLAALPAGSGFHPDCHPLDPVPEATSARLAIPALVRFSSRGLLSGGAEACFEATCVDPHAMDDFSLEVQHESGVARLDLRTSRTAIFVSDSRGEREIAGPRVEGTYEGFVRRAEAFIQGRPCLPAQDASIRDWEKDWSTPSFKEGLEVQEILERLSGQAIARYRKPEDSSRHPRTPGSLHQEFSPGDVQSLQERQS